MFGFKLWGAQTNEPGPFDRISPFDLEKHISKLITTPATVSFATTSSSSSSSTAADAKPTLTEKQVNFWTRFISAADTALASITNSEELNHLSTVETVIKLMNYPNTMKIIAGNTGLAYLIYACDGHQVAAKDTKVTYKGFTSPFASQPSPRSPVYTEDSPNPMDDYPVAKIQRESEELPDTKDVNLDKAQLKKWQEFLNAVSNGMSPLVEEDLLATDDLRDALTRLADTTQLGQTVITSKAISLLVFSWLGEKTTTGQNPLMSPTALNHGRRSLPPTPSSSLAIRRLHSVSDVHKELKEELKQQREFITQQQEAISAARIELTDELKQQRELITQQQVTISQLGQQTIALSTQLTERDAAHQQQTTRLEAKVESLQASLEVLTELLKSQAAARQTEESSLSAKLHSTDSQFKEIDTKLQEITAQSEDLQAIKQKLSTLETLISGLDIKDCLSVVETSSKDGLKDILESLSRFTKDLGEIKEMLAEIVGTESPDQSSSSSSSSASPASAHKGGLKELLNRVSDIATSLDTVIADQATSEQIAGVATRLTNMQGERAALPESSSSSSSSSSRGTGRPSTVRDRGPVVPQHIPPATLEAILQVLLDLRTIAARIQEDKGCVIS